MNNFANIQSKLQEFVKKYYTNELIKGLILFCSFGLLYFIFTLLIEYFLWLEPVARTVLFWLFVLVELVLLINYIIIPIAKLFGFQKGISLQDASRIIGKHFKEVDDKLINILQLKARSDQSELLLASIEQKAKNLQPIPFKRAVDFSKNTKYLKYLAIPFVIWLVTFITGNLKIFSDSYDRVVHYQVAYEPPAPFSFHVLNDDLNVIEGKSLKLQIETRGNTIPDDVKIHFSNQEYYLQNTSIQTFEYTFSSVSKPITFFIKANEVASKQYTVNIIEAPVITEMKMLLNYPSHTNKVPVTVENTGNAIVPQGTNIKWIIDTKNTSKTSFLSEDEEIFETIESNIYEFEKQILGNLEYQIATSNQNLKNYESLGFAIQVVKDEYPKISVRSDIDSITNGPIQFLGQLSDDYGLSSLNLVYYDINSKVLSKSHTIQINNSAFEEFYYVFPDGIELAEGIDYEMYFEITDNDAINGSKKTKSKLFSYYKKTEKELEEQLLEEQENTISDLEKSIEKSKEVDKEFQKMQESLQNKSEMNWNDQKKLQNFIERQQQYEQMMDRQTEKLQQNLEEQPTQKDKRLEERKEDIQKRLQEAKDIAKQEKLLEELQKLAEKLDKEELTEKLKKLTEQNKQNEKNLERLLELTKRFYVEQKVNQIKDKLEELSEKQNELADNEDNSSEKQKELNEEFDKIKKEIDQLEKDNKDLQKPMDLPSTKKEETQVDEEQKEATENLEESEKQEPQENSESQKSKEQSKKSASKNQKSAAQKMKKMSKNMSEMLSSLGGGGEAMDEDIEMLRAILENLLEFSFQQEDLMNNFSETDNTHPEFANNLKKQQVLREYFEYIDDSLYTLSMRQPKISSQVFKELSDAHFYLDESLIHFTENQFNTAISDEQFVMTATNNLAYLLSNILNAMQNASPSMGQGQGSSFGLPDIIQKQGEAMDKMEEGLKKGKKPGEKGEGQKGQQLNGGEGEQMNGELYEIYKQQAQLRKELENALGDKKDANVKGIGEDALKQMEQIEQDLLEKGFTNEVLEKMMELKHELLKLEEAAYEQGQDEKRESNANKQEFEKRNIKDIDRKNLWFNQNEILNRQSLPLRSIYKKKTQEYFRENDSIQ